MCDCAIALIAECKAICERVPSSHDKHHHRENRPNAETQKCNTMECVGAQQSTVHTLHTLIRIIRTVFEFFLSLR